MYKARRRTVLLITDCLITLLLVIYTISFVASSDADSSKAIAFSWITTSFLFGTLTMVGYVFTNRTNNVIERKILYSGETLLLSEFIERIRFSYSLDDFYAIISEVLEQKGDCSVLYIDCIKNYVLYNSPDKITTSKETMDTLSQNFPSSWKNGFFFIGDNFGIVTNAHHARGFLLSNKNHHMYVFCRYTRLFDSVIYPQLFEEFC